MTIEEWALFFIGVLAGFGISGALLIIIAVTKTLYRRGLSSADVAY